MEIIKLLQSGVSNKKGQPLNNVGIGSTHTSGTLRTIPSLVLNPLAKLTLQNNSFHSRRVEHVYLEHMNALHKVGLAPPIFPITGELWKGQDEKWILRMKKNLKSEK